MLRGAGWCVSLAIVFIGVVERAHAGERNRQREPAHVRLDWSSVPDEVIERCSLQGLGGLFLQYLIEEGYAPVDAPSRGVIRSDIEVTGGRFAVTSSLGAERRRRTVAIPEPCDSSVQLDVIRAVLATLEPLREPAVRSRAAATTTTSAPSRRGASPRPPRDRPADRWVDLVAQAQLPGHRRPLASVGVEAAWRLGCSRARLGFGLEGAAMHYEGVTFAEPAAVALVEIAVLERDELLLRLGLDAAALAHVYRGPSSGVHADGRFGARTALTLSRRPRLGIVSRGYGRLFSFTHRDGRNALFESAHWGASVGVFLGFAP